MHVWCPNASGGMTHSTMTIPGFNGHNIAIEDLDFIDGGNFFGINYGTGKLVGVAASEFAGMLGDILVTQEFADGGTGLFRLYWNGSALATEAINAASGSTALAQWEHVTFARAGVREITTTVPVGATGWLGLLGLAALGASRRRRS